ncbi:MAG: LuxR C-terminal-related transcriptional regulator [Tannerellaceae bacterium]|nr:LuxR C-terminal-related transcriptional regulator [Tannerellaceae bacterium]
MHDIANRMCKSIDTIKSYRKSIYTKLNVENITEAVFYALDRKLI